MAFHIHWIIGLHVDAYIDESNMIIVILRGLWIDWKFKSGKKQGLADFMQIIGETWHA